MDEKLRKAWALRFEGKYQEAIAILQEILGEDPLCAPAHHLLGLIYGFIGEFEKSLEELQKAVELDGNFIQARNDLALTYAMLGMYEEAKAEFKKVLEIDPGNALATKHLHLMETEEI
ncbi:tetratricopeptide repeat protein [bacterium]|nr:tetratricopeptide repeat protein [bacterium]